MNSSSRCATTPHGQQAANIPVDFIKWLKMSVNYPDYIPYLLTDCGASAYLFQYCTVTSAYHQDVA
jgi:hypothetical protein